MSFRTACSCGQQLSFEDRHLGKKVRCPGCKQTFTARRPEDEPAKERPAEGKKKDEDDEAPYRVAGLRADAVRAPRRRGEPEVEEEEEENPRRRPRFEDDEINRTRRQDRQYSRQRVPGGLQAALWNRHALYTLLMGLVFSGAMVGCGTSERTLSQQASDTPQQLTLAQLITRGYGDNAHVVVTDFVPAENYVYSYHKSRFDVTDGKGARWDKVYVPLVPLTPELRGRLAAAEGQGRPVRLAPSTVQVVLICDHVSNEEGLETVLAQNQLQGTVVNSIRSLDSKTADLLRTSYTATDFNRCILIDYHRRPAGVFWANLLILLGATGMAVTLGVGLLAIVLKVRG